jgi:hypothetical protein
MLSKLPLAGVTRLNGAYNVLPYMSFSDFDVERGVSNTRAALPSSAEDAQFKNLQGSLSIQVFKINANVQGILKLVDKLGTGRDTGSVRKALCALLRYI